MTSWTVSLVTAAASPVFRVDTGSFLTIVVTAALAGTVAAVAGQRNVFLPVVVLELLFGVIVGPQVLDLAHVNAFTAFFSDLGLGMLFFFAGYEIDFARIQGEPLRLGALAWAMSLAIAYGIGGALAAAGVVVSLVFVDRRSPPRRSARCSRSSRTPASSRRSSAPICWRREPWASSARSYC